MSAKRLPRPAPRLVSLLALLPLLAAQMLQAVPAQAHPARSGAGTAMLAGAAAATGARPNIVVIMTDDQDLSSLQHMQYVGNTLAREGTAFTNFFASNPLCCPARATFLTGRYTHNHKVWHVEAPYGGYQVWKQVNPTQDALPVWLQQAGYHTGHIGKYMNDYRGGEVPPGWNEFAGAMTPWTSNYYNFPLYENGATIHYANVYQTDLYATKAVEFIRGKRYGTRPFLLHVAFAAPHVDFCIEPRYAGCDLPGPTPATEDEGYYRNEPLPLKPSFNESDVSDKPSFVKGRAALTPAQVSETAQHYRRTLEALRSVDRAVKKIVETIDADPALAGNTIVLFLSDNGYMYGEHRVPSVDGNAKLYPYEESIHIPLVVRGAGVRANQTVAAPTVNVDLAPTILELAGVSRQTDGLSLVPWLRLGTASSWRSDVLLEGLRDEAICNGAPWYHGLRTIDPTSNPPRNFLAVRYCTGEEEFYDLVQDPYQLRNTATGITTEMRNRVRALATCSGSACR